MSSSFPRRPTRPVFIGGVQVGGGAPIVVQSMTKTPTHDAAATIAQIRRLEKAGCELVRLAVPDRRAAEALPAIKKKARAPLIADVHFDHRLALAALEAGVDGLRLNPGTIGPKEGVRRVVAAALERRVPIRIGVNSGSLEKALLARHGGATAEAMAESALGHIRLLEDLGFDLIKVSLKASDVARTVEAHRILAGRVPYPFHLGVTEAGNLEGGVIKSSVGLGILLGEGLGDTIRVSLTAPPEDEVRVAYAILQSLGLRSRGINLVTCPTCGRIEVDMMKYAELVARKLRSIDVPLTVALMGCTVNGPGEAREADIGIACGRGAGTLFKSGKLVRRIKADRIVAELVAETRALAAERLKSKGD